MDSRKVIQCKKYPITYTLVIKQVKNINMRISPKGEIVVSANPFVPLDKIDEFVSSKVSWIVEHQKKVVEKAQRCLLSDKEIMLFGKQLKIKKSAGRYNYVSYDDKYLYVQLKQDADVEKVITQFLNKLCKDVFMDVATLTCNSLKDYQIPFPEVKIRTMKSSKKSGGTFPCSTLFSFKSFFLVFDVLYICKIDNMIYYSIKMNGILCQGNCISLFTLPFFIGLIHQKN